MNISRFFPRPHRAAVSAAALMLWLGPQAAARADDKPTVTPYGLVEFDAVYSTRNTNPLDPNQFNGYLTAAAPDAIPTGKTDSTTGAPITVKGDKATSTFNPRFTLLGIKAEHEGLKAVGEFDFYGSDGIGLIAPRLRLGYIDLTTENGRVTLGQDWLPIMSSHPAAMDFSIMGYGGNLWIRLPQITYRHKASDTFEVLGTLFRNERSGFTDPSLLPYVGARAAYTGSGLFALSAAFRSFKVDAGGKEEGATSYLVGTEVSLPAGPVTLSGELGLGAGLGNEFFRFGQAMNGKDPVMTIVGWANVVYPMDDWTFALGYGHDNPKNDDLKGSAGGQYTVNQRIFGNVVKHIYKGFKVGGEVTQAMTSWVGDTKSYAGQQVMLSGFYSF
ncbi:MAG: hypothetical protein HYT87_18150 [Nitrospirae bacterium]|nr:hypothetical protein [Nitrospirota bacterium]